MRITVFGASGKVGRLVVEEALQRGHEVTAFVHKASLNERDKLHTYQGDIYDKKSVAEAVDNAEAVISCLSSWGTPKKDILSSAMLNIVPVMEANNTKRIISLTGAGAVVKGDKFNLLNHISNMGIMIFASKVFKDGQNHVEILRSSQLDWTAVRSPIMNNLGVGYKLTQQRPVPWATISRSAVATAMVDLVESREYARQAPFICRG